MKPLVDKSFSFLMWPFYCEICHKSSLLRTKMSFHIIFISPLLSYLEKLIYKNFDSFADPLGVQGRKVYVSGTDNCLQVFLISSYRILGLCCCPKFGIIFESFQFKCEFAQNVDWLKLEEVTHLPSFMLVKPFSFTTECVYSFACFCCLKKCYQLFSAKRNKNRKYAQVY